MRRSLDPARTTSATTSSTCVPARAVLVAAVGLVLALAASDDFLTDFTTFLTLLLYMFAPWTAVNLVDFYVVRKGHYSIREIFNPAGMYGRWSARGIAAYLIGLAAMVPFNSTTLYTGPVADALDGADLSVFVGIPVAGATYVLLTRSLDLRGERERIPELDADLEPAPAPAPAGPSSPAG